MGGNGGPEFGDQLGDADTAVDVRANLRGALDVVVGLARLRATPGVDRRGGLRQVGGSCTRPSNEVVIDRCGREPLPRRGASHFLSVWGNQFITPVGAGGAPMARSGVPFAITHVLPASESLMKTSVLSVRIPQRSAKVMAPRNAIKPTSY
ncbi:hypothetical protein MMRN_52060 [Mycobacterium marinum]|nr:hypothetical protein MMRN_52060 [Mycobacterium marinum]